MAKIKLNLSTGVVEKPILSCFKKENNTYLILDAESVGNMGMPIIYVCKIDGDKVVKITDAGEWQNVKGYLKSIISGQAMEYTNPKEEMSADDVYFTQLTLSNDNLNTIKGNYVVTEEQNAPQPAPVEPVSLEPSPAEPATMEPVAPVEPVNPAMDPSLNPTIDPAINPVVTPEPIIPDITPVEPVTPTPEVDPVTPVEPVVTPEPVIDPVIPTDITTEPLGDTTTDNKNIDEIKQKFIKGCEMMFDALAELNK